MPKTDRVVIIGAGPAGISLGAFLRTAHGYKDVVVLESSDHIGGKCNSPSIDGAPYDLGAVEVTPNYRQVLVWASQLGLDLRAQPPRGTVNPASSESFGLRALTGASHGLAAARLEYLAYAHRHDLTEQLGLGSTEVPLGPWLTEHGIDPLGPFIFGGLDPALVQVQRLATTATTFLDRLEDSSTRKHLLAIYYGPGPLEVAFAFAKYLYLVGWAYRDAVESPHMRALPQPLMKPFADWAMTERIGAMVPYLESTMAAYGYGIARDVPAIYYLRCFPLINVIMGAILGLGIRRWPRSFALGFQALFVRLAERDLKDRVHLNRTVTNISRAQDGTFEISTQSSETYKANVVVLTSCLDGTARTIFPDLPKPVLEALERVQVNRYCSQSYSVPGFPYSVMTVAPRTPRGRPWLMFKQWRQPHHVTLYTLADSQSREEIVERSMIDLGALGYPNPPCTTVRDWRYFPHFKTAELEAGLVDLLEQEQGKGGVYFCGGLLAFETVHNVVDHARYVAGLIVGGDGLLAEVAPSAGAPAGIAALPERSPAAPKGGVSGAGGKAGQLASSRSAEAPKPTPGGDATPRKARSKRRSKKPRRPPKQD